MNTYLCNLYKIGDFYFKLLHTEELIIPSNFQKFIITQEQSELNIFPYTYKVEIVDNLPSPEGQLKLKREDIEIYTDGTKEYRLIGVKGIKEFYAYYKEKTDSASTIYLVKNRIHELNIDPMFTSLLALERHMMNMNSLVLHCAYIEYQGQAILFSAPSETGKSTQANLWEKYRGARTINGDRSLLSNRDGIWHAGGWPVCGTSEICINESFPIRAIVMLSQAKDNTTKKIDAGTAFKLLYSQITINRWDMQSTLKGMNLIEDLLGQVPVYCLECNISEGAVNCLEKGIAFD